MKETIKPSEKLDAIMIYLKESKMAYEYGYGLPRNYNKPKSGIKVKDDEILNILDRLKKDDLVRVTEMGIGNGNPNSAEHYALNFDGELLLQKGGYTEKYKADKIKRDIEEQHLKRSRQNERVITYGSSFAAIGAIGLLLLEIYKVFCLTP